MTNTSPEQVQWEKAAAAVLRKARRLTEDAPDAAVWEALAVPNLDGVAPTPLGLPGTPAVGARPTRAGAWEIRSQVDAVTLSSQAANDHALSELAGGASGLWLYADSAADLTKLLDGVLTDIVPIVLESENASEALAEALLGSGVALHAESNLGLDPLGLGLRNGAVDGAEVQRLAQDWAQRAVDAGIGAFVVDGTAVHDAGASEAQELGWIAASATAYLRALADVVGLEAAAKLIQLRVAVTDDQFASIAKVRALRVLWANIVAASGIAGAPVHVHAVTSRPMMSAYDPHTNMLRATVAAFAAGIGGADSITVVPFDAAQGRDSELGRRIARNVNHLLIEESHIAVVADPAGGAWAVESQTSDLAQAGWAEFGALEGEWAESITVAGLLARVAATVERRSAQVATRDLPLTGLSEFPDAGEQPVEIVPNRLNDRAQRWGAAFEELRSAPAAHDAYLVTLGSVAAHTARATFVTNLLSAGGVAVTTSGPIDTADAAVAGLGGRTVAVIAGAEPSYAELGAEVASALRAAGVKHISVAGKARDWADSHAAMGDDAISYLGVIRKELGA